MAASLTRVRRGQPREESGAAVQKNLGYRKPPPIAPRWRRESGRAAQGPLHGFLRHRGGLEFPLPLLVHLPPARVFAGRGRNPHLHELVTRLTQAGQGVDTFMSHGDFRFGQGGRKRNYRTIVRLFTEWDASQRMPRVEDGQKLNAALSLHQKGDLSGAARLYRELINGNSRNFPALHFLGCVEATRGNLLEARRLMARSLSIHPPNVQFIENYAALLTQAGDYRTALDVCRDGLKLDANSATLLYANAQSLFSVGKYDEALANFDTLIAIQPRHLGGRNGRACVLAELKRYDDALADIEEALAINRNSFDAHVNKGNILELTKRCDEAVAAYDKALTLKPEPKRALAKAWFGRGKALGALARPEEALISFDKALALEPDFADACGERGFALLELGRLQEASEASERAIALAPSAARFYRLLTMSRRLSPGEPHLRAMERLARDLPSLPAAEQIALNFALAKAGADVGDREGSFRRLIDGNAAKRRQVAYDQQGALRLLRDTQRVFSAELMRRNEGVGEPSRVPVFIIGMPRSGTTLIEQILASHPEAFGAGEIADFGEAIAESESLAAGAMRFPDMASRMGEEQFRGLGASYLRRIRAKAPAAARIANKTPGNFIFAGLIHLALPNARIIHVRRDPVDTCLSCFSQDFAADYVPFANDLSELGRYYRAYDVLMGHWRGLLPQSTMLEVQYEDVVADLEGQARRIIGHCGLNWDPRCLDFHETVRPVRTSSAAQVRQPIYRSSVGRWRDYQAFLEPLLAELGPLLENQTADSPEPRRAER